ncbi:MAG: hypothetical protein MJA27_29015 [Pseudanabaenales cyanobacterium]|nr:hypothetical protein [Pseudanabaenales cyanobacterium]
MYPCQYGDTTIRHDARSCVAVEFLDFYRANDTDNTLKYLVIEPLLKQGAPCPVLKTVQQVLSLLNDGGLSPVELHVSD